MRNIKMTVLIGESFDRMIEMLFRPFSMKKWMKLTIVALLAGMLLGTNGMGGGNNNNNQTVKKESAVSTQEAKTAALEKGNAAKESGSPAQSPEEARRNGIIVLSVVLGIMAIILLFIIFMTWIGARFKFVWLNAVIKNTDSIIEPYSRLKAQGNSFFRLSLCLLAAFILGIVLVVGSIIYGLVSNGVFQHGFAWTFKVAMSIFLAPVLGGIVSLLGFFIFAFLVEHFVVSIMAFDEISSSQALKRLGSILRQNWKDVTLFLLVVLLLSIMAGTVAVFLALFIILALLIAAVVIFGVPFLIFGLWLKLKLAFIIYAIVTGIPFIAFCLMAVLAASLPFALFFRILTLKYLISLNVGYGADSLEKYSAKKADHLSRRMPVVISIVVVFLLMFTFIVGLLAAIAVPNFIKARQNAMAKKAGTSVAVTVKK